MPKTYKTTDFDYVLPDALIAKYPLEKRSASRLLVVDRANNSISHQKFSDLLNYLSPQDLVVFNNTKVIPARLFGNKESGGKVEFLIERVLTNDTALAHIRTSKALKTGGKIHLDSRYQVEIMSRQANLFELKFSDSVHKILTAIGEMPLPPYMERKPEKSDLDRYQTVYAKEEGAVAAPTAGLHFDEQMLVKIHNKIEVTLHVGAGTFQPVRVENINEHVMHSEWMDLPVSVCDAVNKAERVMAVGTTSVRCLETAAREGEIKPYQGETDIFIYPGYEFKVIDKLLTNFHLPKSTLMMLVCAFGGYDLMMRAYEEAVREKYRFYSYGDAMLIV